MRSSESSQDVANGESREGEGEELCVSFGVGGFGAQDQERDGRSEEEAV